MKISKGIGVLTKLRHFVQTDVLKQLYHAFISPHISYGLINWGFASKCSTTKLNTNLKRAVRIMTFSGFKDNSKPLFTKLSLLNFENLHKLEVAKFMYDVINNNLASTISNLFEKTKARHSYKTRQATQNQFALPVIYTECRKKSIFFNGIKIWNEIPLEIRSMKSKTLFKKYLSNWLLHHS